MYCLRCGREKPEKQVFCDACLDNMSRHPVKPDVTVYIPSRKPREIQKKQFLRKKKAPTAEEMVLILKKRIKALWVTVLILVLLLGCCGAGIYFAWQHDPNLIIGQNYKTVDTTGGETGSGASGG